MNCYEKNETMKMLEEQRAMFIYRDGIKEKIDDIAKARPFSVTTDAAIDIFMLGYIYGKRAERSRKKRKRQSVNA